MQRALRPASSVHRTAPQPILRRLAGPLVIYHVMILIGAFLIIAGGSWGYWRLVGAVLVGAGIAVELSILAWSASLATSASTRTGEFDSTLPTSAPGAPRRICVACGQEGSVATLTCPRCGKPVVSLRPPE